MAYYAQPMVYGLCIYSAGRQQERKIEKDRQYVGRLFSVRSMARGGLDVRIMGINGRDLCLRGKCFEKTRLKIVRKTAYPSRFGHFAIAALGYRYGIVQFVCDTVPRTEYKRDHYGVQSNIYGERIRNGLLVGMRRTTRTECGKTFIAAPFTFRNDSVAEIDRMQSRAVSWREKSFDIRNHRSDVLRNILYRFLLACASLTDRRERISIFSVLRRKNENTET